VSEIIYNTKEYFPQQLFPFKLISAFPGLLVFKIIRYWIERNMPNSYQSRIMPGFCAVIGKNIFAKNVYLNDTLFLDYAPIEIGEGTVFSGRNSVLTSTHDLDNFDVVRAEPIKIGANVWITHNCTILGGVSIGDNSVIGAGSVVTKDIPANVFAAGNPCKVIKQINRGVL
jgi:maltose O-acetyltransferase